jgi:pyruvate kinase
MDLPNEIDALIAELTAIRAEMLELAAQSLESDEELFPAYRESAANLVHYLALRRRDLRGLQMRLAALGLSSLGRAESHALATVTAVLKALHSIGGRPWHPPRSESPALDFDSGQELLGQHTETLLGPTPQERSVRIMVTMPSEGAEDYVLIHKLLQQGMDCMRINCAHDDDSAWLRMIEHLRRAERSLGKSCRIIMDLAGPKLRTGPLEPGPAVVKIRPQRDAYGKVTAPARVWLTGEHSPQPPPSSADACIRIPTAWLIRLRRGERVTLTDARGASRAFQVADVRDEGCWVEATRTTYLVPGTVLHHEPGSGRGNTMKAAVPDFPPVRERPIVLHVGDLLILTGNLKPGGPASQDSAGKVLSPASIGCTLPEVFDDVRAGEPIWFDDGKIGGLIERVESDRVLVRITHARTCGDSLRADKGINFPESNLSLAALTAQDIEDLQFVAQHADMVALSFANRAGDVELLQEHIARIGPRRLAIVLKIETKRGFENLPAMLLAAMKTPCCGVMIARGDLAVECGFERLAEVQEEILWICEAAHVPVIWATQVLESLARQGTPSRAEITDAAMGHRAECVMLNKGPHILTAVQVLNDILIRMQAHQAKKSSMLRELRLAHVPVSDH